MSRLARNEAGQVTIWVLGLSIALLAIGGISLDLWRVISERSELAVIADSAAVAGASEIDIAVFRSTSGDVVLDPTAAAGASLAYLSGIPLSAPPGITVSDTLVVVELHREVDLTLLKALNLGIVETVPITVTGSSEPRVGG